MSNHAQLSAQFLKDEDRADWHNQSLLYLRQNRDKAAASVADWENLRQQASDIKTYTLHHLKDLLLQFEANALKNGVKVHWAKDGAEHNRIVKQILEEKNIRLLVKSKSMLTEECGLNRFLEKEGIQVIDTDLGERIIQMRKEPPSHIVVPAIHLKKEEVGELFHEQIHTEKGNSNPEYLTAAARTHLRTYFQSAEAALTGVNFGIAENGGVLVCTNEGNADMGIHSKKVIIHSMGLEKLLPRQKDLGVFLRLLARSGTGQAVTVYSSQSLKPRPGTTMNIILVDNGRSKILSDEAFMEALKCIRCGACMNTCPVYRRSGGYSYQNFIPGPIGSILAPFQDVHKYGDLPFASTLCGSCNDVCPVKIDLMGLLYKWRQRLGPKQSSLAKKVVMQQSSGILSSAKRYQRFGKLIKWIPRFLLQSTLNPWNKGRVFPEIPSDSFKTWYQKNRK